MMYFTTRRNVSAMTSSASPVWAALLAAAIRICLWTTSSLSSAISFPTSSAEEPPSAADSADSAVLAADAQAPEGSSTVVVTSV